MFESKLLKKAEEQDDTGIFRIDPGLSDFPWFFKTIHDEYGVKSRSFEVSPGRQEIFLSRASMDDDSYEELLQDPLCFKVIMDEEEDPGGGELMDQLEKAIPNLGFVVSVYQGDYDLDDFWIGIGHRAISDAEFEASMDGE